MGPRSSERGNEYEHRLMWRDYQLQWGRAQVSAEMLPVELSNCQRAKSNPASGPAACCLRHSFTKLQSRIRDSRSREVHELPDGNTFGSKNMIDPKMHETARLVQVRMAE